MTTITIGVLFPATFNLNADAANASVLARRLDLSGHETHIVSLDIDEMNAGRAVDALVIGSGSSSIVTAAETTSPVVRDYVRNAMDSAVPILAVSNGLHLFGSMTAKGGQSIQGWELAPMHTTFGTTQHVTIGMRVETAWGTVVGVENHNATVEIESEARPFGTVLHGVGNNSGQIDGIEFGSVWGTHVNGPLFALNPAIADEFARRVVARTGAEYIPGPELAQIDRLSKQTADHLVRKQSS